MPLSRAGSLPTILLQFLLHLSTAVDSDQSLEWGLELFGDPGSTS